MESMDSAAKTAWAHGRRALTMAVMLLARSSFTMKKAVGTGKIALEILNALPWRAL